MRYEREREAMSGLTSLRKQADEAWRRYDESLRRLGDDIQEWHDNGAAVFMEEMDENDLNEPEVTLELAEQHRHDLVKALAKIDKVIFDLKTLMA